MTSLRVTVCEARDLRVRFGEPVFVRALFGDTRQTAATTKYVWNEDLEFDVSENSPPILTLQLHGTSGVVAHAIVDLGELEELNETLVLPLRSASGKLPLRDGTLKVTLSLLGCEDVVPRSPISHDLSLAKMPSSVPSSSSSSSSFRHAPSPPVPPSRPPPPLPPAPPTLGGFHGVLVHVDCVLEMEAKGCCILTLTCGSITRKTTSRDCKALTWDETILFPNPGAPAFELVVEFSDDVDVRGEGSVTVLSLCAVPAPYSVELFAMVWRERTRTGLVKLSIGRAPVSSPSASRVSDLPDCPSFGALSSVSGSSTSSRIEAHRVGRKTSPPDIHLSILVMKAQDLDPSLGEVTVKFSHKDTAVSTTLRDAADPVWNEVVRVILPPECPELLVELCGADGPLGEGSISSSNFTDQPLLVLEVQTYFWHRQIKVAALHLSLRRVPAEVPRPRTPSQGELTDAQVHLGIPSSQPPSPRHGKPRLPDSSMRNAPELDDTKAVPWIIVTTPEEGDSPAPLLVNCMLSVEVVEVEGLKAAPFDWVYVKVTYAKQTFRTQAASRAVDSDKSRDVLAFGEGLQFPFAGHHPIQFLVVDIIRNVELASATLAPSRVQYVNSSHAISLTPTDATLGPLATLRVDLRLVSKSQIQSTKVLSRDPAIVETELRNKDQKIAELEVRIEQMQRDLTRLLEFERIVAPLQQELKNKSTAITELRRMVSRGADPNAGALLVTIGHGIDLGAVFNLHVRVQYKSQVLKTTVRDSGVWDETLTVEIDGSDFAAAPPEEHELLIQVYDSETCMGSGTLALALLGLVDDGPPVQTVLPLQHEFWHKVEACGELHVGVALRLSYRRPSIMRTGSNLPILNVLVVAGIDLRAVNDLHVQLVFEGQAKKTRVLDETYHPIWNETLTFFIRPEDPGEELQVEAYSADVCIGRGTVILSELDDEEGEPVLEVQLFQIFLHHRTPAGAVRVKIGIQMNTFSAVMGSRKDQILKLEDTVAEKDASIERLRQQLAMKDERLWQLEQALMSKSQEMITQVVEDAPMTTNCVFWFTICEATGLRVDPKAQYYVRVTFDGASHRTPSAPGSSLRWDERLRFEGDLETLDDELEVTVFHDTRVSGAVGTGSFRISDLEFADAYEEVEVPLLYDDRPAGSVHVRVECCVQEAGVDNPGDESKPTEEANGHPNGVPSFIASDSHPS
jgi:hypothetical protein